MALTHVLFCTVISVWGFQLSKWYYCVHQVSKCALSGAGKGVSRDPADTGRGQELLCLSTGRDSAVREEIPSCGCRAGWPSETTGQVVGTCHTTAWGPRADRAAGGSLLRTLVNRACGWLLIPVNQRHYGDLKIFLVSLQMIVIMAALF